MLENAAMEPEIVDLPNAWSRMGAKIEARHAKDRGRGRGAPARRHHAVIADRIETGTFRRRGDDRRQHRRHARAPGHAGCGARQVREAGADRNRRCDRIALTCMASGRAVNVTTAPHPAFPTDMQAQFMALNCMPTASA